MIVELSENEEIEEMKDDEDYAADDVNMRENEIIVRLNTAAVGNNKSNEN